MNTGVRSDLRTAGGPAVRTAVRTGVGTTVWNSLRCVMRIKVQTEAVSL